MNILQLNTSARPYAKGSGSFSTRLANDLVQGLREATPGSTLTVRDLAQTPLPYLDGGLLTALTDAASGNPAQHAGVALLDEAIAELMAADVIVLGVPMYNFGVPVQLKAWIDGICRAGVTFRYTDRGLSGLVQGKTVYAVISSGGFHRNQPTDLITPYLKVVLGFLGMTAVNFVYVEGLAMGPEGEAKAVADAQSQIADLLASVKAG